ncbi:EAL domain-containing protein [Burkholderia pseudomultivorans]|uniref:EAL domain-containing protein n=1 Tax=Burkholderia pseudomultivorans TaxID=1207504 RepID=UPI002875ABB5|nr:EAL domain-containing protein [Burkholderia pseudomultivorans]MDS0793925.1 EAL domain-containing protein [Burkholderia pseudomultivorans]
MSVEMRPDPASLASDIDRAIAREEFEPWLQPIVNADGGRWIGAEVLARWRHPEAGLIGADRFIACAEASGQVVPITSSLMGQLCRALRGRLPVSGTAFRLGVNVSAAQFVDRTLVADCRALLDGLSHDRVALQLELTERMPISPTPATLRMLDELRDIGASLAIDDFGTGHASFEWLQTFPVNALKLDKRFVSRIESDEVTAHIVDAIVTLADKLGVEIIAEGVERTGQQGALLARGVIHQQGYLFGRPMPLDEFVERLGTSASSTPLPITCCESCS